MRKYWYIVIYIFYIYINIVRGIAALWYSLYLYLIITQRAEWSLSLDPIQAIGTGVRPDDGTGSLHSLGLQSIVCITTDSNSYQISHWSQSLGQSFSKLKASSMAWLIWNITETKQCCCSARSVRIQLSRGACTLYSVHSWRKSGLGIIM